MKALYQSAATLGVICPLISPTPLNKPPSLLSSPSIVWGLTEDLRYVLALDSCLDSPLKTAKFGIECIADA